MTSADAQRDSERIEIECCLQVLSRGHGIQRKDLVGLLRGDLSRLNQHLCIPLETGRNVVADGVAAILEGHIRNLYPRWGQLVRLDAPADEVRRLRVVARVGFNVKCWPELREMDLMDRWDWLNKPLVGEKLTHPDQERRPVVPERTSRHLFKQVTRQIAERMVPGAAVAASAKPEAMPLPSRPTPRSSSSFTHLVDLSGELKDALNHVRDTCEAQHRAFYTSDLVVTLLTLRGDCVARCFDEVQPGLSSTIRDQLAATLDPDRQHEPFAPFAWLERADVQLAGQYAIDDGKPIVTDLDLLLAILDGDSATNRWLQRLLGKEHRHVRAVAERYRHEGPTVINSPTPDGL
jgi:hypothetical protein